MDIMKKYIKKVKIKKKPKNKRKKADDFIGGS